MGNKIGRLLRNLFIILGFMIIPLGIFAGIFFSEMSDYSMYEDEVMELRLKASDLEHEFYHPTRFIPMPNGEYAIFTETVSDDYNLVEWSPETGEINNRYSIDSDTFGDSFVVYQSDDVIFVTKGEDNQVNLYQYQYGQEPTLMEHEILYNDHYLNQNSTRFGNDFFTVGSNSEGDYVALALIDGSVTITNFSQMDNIENITDIEMHTNPANYPVVKLSNFEREEFYYDLMQPDASLEHFSDLSRTEIDDHYISQFTDAETFLTSTTDTIHAVNLFSPDLTLLNPDTFLLTGKTNQQANGPVRASLLNETGEDLLTELPDLEIWIAFDGGYDPQASIVDDTIYLSTTEEAGIISLASGELVSHTGMEDFEAAIEDTVIELEQEADRLEEEGETFSLERVQHFATQSIDGRGILWFSLLMFVIPIFGLSIIFYFMGRKRRNIKKAYANGAEIVPAKLISMKRTGVSVNDNPQVRMTVEYTFRRQVKQGEVKEIIDMLQPPQVGDEFDLLYDPVRDKLFTLDE